MNALISCCFIALSIPMVGQEVAIQNQQLKNQIMVSIIDPKLKALPLERWKAAILPPLPKYPGLSQIAGIEGELLMHCKVATGGKVAETRLVSGPPQLASTLDRWVRQIQFKVLPEDGEGPWHYAVSARFSLPNKVQFFPSAIMLNPTLDSPNQAQN